MVDPGDGDRGRTCVVALLAGGTGTRFGADRPKQLLTVAGRPLLEHTLRAFHGHPGVDAITLVMAPGHLEAAQTIVREGRYHDKVTAIVAPLMNGQHGGLLLELKMEDGRTLVPPVPAINTFKRTE